jgi:ADP-L-glycero-D-manno-heptose 6-epimerase
MIIVTGATGFIGSNIVADLNAAGRSDIILVDDLGTEPKWKNIAKRRFQDIVLPAELNAFAGIALQVVIQEVRECSPTPN